MKQRALLLSVPLVVVLCAGSIIARGAPPLRTVMRLPLAETTGPEDLGYSPNGNYIATAGEKGLKLWDAVTGKLLYTRAGKTLGVQHLAFSPDSTRLAAISGGDLTLYDTVTGRALRTITGDAADFRVCRFFPDSQRILTGSYGMQAKVWDTKTGHLLLTLKNTLNRYFDIAISPDGRWIASGHGKDNEPGFLAIWDARSGKRVRVIPYKVQIITVCFSPDSSRVASGGSGESKIWDRATGRSLLSLGGHEGVVDAVVYSPDGKRLATGSEDGNIHLWDAATGAPLLSLKAAESWTMRLAFSPDGKRLLSINDKDVQVWDVQTK